MVTGVEVVIGNCLLKVHKYCSILGTKKKKFPIMVDDASGHLSCYTSTHASIWHRYGDMAVWSFSWKALPGTDWGWSLVGRRSSVGPQYYAYLIYSSSLP